MNQRRDEDSAGAAVRIAGAHHLLHDKIILQVVRWRYSTARRALDAMTAAGRYIKEIWI